MTSTVTELTKFFVTSSSDPDFSTTMGVIAILLLLMLLAQKELGRSTGGMRARTWVLTFNIAIIPLLIAFGYTIIMRFLDLLSK